jgi:ABC-2 type transport system ATP-binding protein
VPPPGGVPKPPIRRSTDHQIAAYADGKTPPAIDAVHMNENASPQRSPYVIETRGLTKRFGARVALDGVDLAVPRGCAFGFLGPNGAGKTTLIRTLLGLTEATSGTARLLGRAMPAERAAALARVGAVVEEPRFHPHLTGRENLSIVAAAREREAHARIPAALERVGLTERADERVARYSLGMRQRLGIARCLIADPELLILDEPTNGLDPAGIQQFREFVRELVAEGRTVFLSSHLLDEVEKVCDAVAIVDGGRVVTQGNLGEVARRGRVRIQVACSEPGRATLVLSTLDDVESVVSVGDHLELAVRADADAVASEVARRLVGAGIDVRRLDVAKATLEQRFLEITARLEEAA